MRKNNKKWIQRAVKHKGSLRKWAQEHHFILENGNIDLNKAKQYAENKGLKHRIRQIDLAKNLKKWRKKR